MPTRPVKRLLAFSNWHTLLRPSLVQHHHLGFVRIFSQCHVSFSPRVPVDSFCLPIHPVPPPTFPSSSTSLSDDELIHLHQLSALKPPPTGSDEFQNLKADLQSMFEVVNSVTTYHPSDEPVDCQITPVQDAMCSGGATQAVPWDAILKAQESFITRKAETIPGVYNPNQHVPLSCERSCPEAELVIGMAQPDVHLIKRRGVGQAPHKENVYYAVRRIQEHKS